MVKIQIINLSSDCPLGRSLEAADQRLMTSRFTVLPSR